jgi:hypothetical protein
MVRCFQPTFSTLLFLFFQLNDKAKEKSKSCNNRTGKNTRQKKQHPSYLYIISVHVTRAITKVCCALLYALIYITLLCKIAAPRPALTHRTPALV